MAKDSAHSLTKHLSTVGSSERSSAQTCIQICGFVKPEQAFPLKEEQPSRGGEMGAFHLKLLPIFSSGVLCLETSFLKEIELKADALTVLRT